MEPAPNLNVESRDYMDGRLDHPHQVLAAHVAPRVAAVLDEGRIYGEKNVTLGAFVPELHELLRCRFVYLKRDGRDVVTSLMNWHNEGFGSIYRECAEQDDLSEVARAAVARLPVESDTSDYSRPRPRPGEPFHDEWARLSRFEMMAWYWAHVARLHTEHLARIPAGDWIAIDYTRPSAEDVARVFDFLGLKGFDRCRVDEMLRARINSVWDRFQLPARFPPWPQWGDDYRARFDRMAGEAMQTLGYAT
jgi:hypothetical protein